MVDPEDRLLRDLARLRERSGPPVGAEQRVRAALDAAIGPGSGSGDDGGSASGDGGSSMGGPGSAGLGGGKLALASKVIAATVAITSVGLLVNLGVTRDRSSRDVDMPPATVAATPSAGEPPSTAQPEPPPESEPILVTPRAQAPTPVQRTSERDEDPLTAEVTLLEQARATTDLSVRLELLELHRSRFEDGLFAAERESLRISTLCELDQLDRARRAAEDFLLAHPRSPLRLRMRSACPELDILAD